MYFRFQFLLFTVKQSSCEVNPRTSPAEVKAQLHPFPINDRVPTDTDNCEFFETQRTILSDIHASVRQFPSTRFMGEYSIPWVPYPLPASMLREREIRSRIIDSIFHGNIAPRSYLFDVPKLFHSRFRDLCLS